MGYFEYHGDPVLAREQMETLMAQGKKLVKRGVKYAYTWSHQADGSINWYISFDFAGHLFAKDATKELKAMGRELIDVISLSVAFKMFGLSEYGYTEDTWFAEWGVDYKDLERRILKAKLPPLDLSNPPGVKFYPTELSAKFRKDGYWVCGTDVGKADLTNAISCHDTLDAATVAASKLHYTTGEAVDIIRVTDGVPRFTSWVLMTQGRVAAELRRAEAEEAYLAAMIDDEPFEPDQIYLQLSEWGHPEAAWASTPDQDYEAFVGDHGIEGYKKVLGIPNEAGKWNTIAQYNFGPDGSIGVIRVTFEGKQVNYYTKETE